MKQRQLTQEELNLAPEWATDVRYRNKSFVFTDGKYKVQFLDGGRCDSTKVKNWNLIHKIQPIPRKAFDLSYSDASGILDVSVTGDNLGVVTTYTDIGDIYETKQDIINKAKALGVTASDFIDTKPDNAIIDDNETK